MVQFELISDLNKWTEENKALQLAGSFRGQAQSILSDLSNEERINFQHLVTALTNRFEPENQMEIYRSQLKAKLFLRSKGETLANLSQEIQKFVRKAYPNVSKEMKD